MRKIAIAMGLLLFAAPAFAAVTVSTQPTSLVTSPITIGASSTPVALFSFTLSGDASETLASVVTTLAAVGGSTVTGSDIASLAVYKDANSNGTFESGTDLLVGSQTSVNVGTPTTITASVNNSLTGGAKFFVTLATGASWSGASPVDNLTATIGATGISTSANSPTITPATTSTVSATAVVVDTTGPVLTTAVMSTTSPKTVTLTFGEATNSPTINAANINTVLALSNSHSWLDGASAIGSATWSSDGKTLTVTLSSATSTPTIAVGDMVTVSGSVVKDAAGNNATGAVAITQTTSSGGDGSDENGEGHACMNTLINGRLYKVGSETTVYLAASCRLKPFRGAAVFHARGNKFQNIIVLSALPTDAVSTDPALPASGTLVKGSDAAVWFVETGHKRKGFANAQAFLGLGFKFNQVNQISDSDLTTMPVDTAAITTDTQHPDGALVKCSNSNTVFQVTGQTGQAFANLDSFTLRGHTFAQVASIDCGKFHYVLAQTITQ